MPGKFPNDLAEALYQISLDGPDEEMGSVDEMGWYGLLLGITPEEMGEFGQDVVDEMEGAQNFILSEDSYGFVDYEAFESEADAKARWEEIAFDIGEPGGEEEE